MSESKEHLLFVRVDSSQYAGLEEIKQRFGVSHSLQVRHGIDLHFFMMNGLFRMERWVKSQDIHFLARQLAKSGQYPFSPPFVEVPSRFYDDDCQTVVNLEKYRR